MISEGQCKQITQVFSLKLLQFYSVSVILGEHNTETERDCTEDQSSCADKVQIVNVAEAISHQHYDQFSEDHHNDIGLIELKKGARLTSKKIT